MAVTDYDNLTAIFPGLVQDITDVLAKESIPLQVIERMRDAICMNVLDGRFRRLLAIPESGRILLGRQLTQEELRGLGILGWLCEMYSNYFIILDDVIDDDSVRRGRQCWHKRAGVGLLAANEAGLVAWAVFVLLKKHFDTHRNYTQLIECFNQAFFMFGLGQESDTLASLEKDPARWTLQQYDVTCKHKGGWLFHLCMATTLYYLDLGTAGNIERTKNIALLMGMAFQKENDYGNIYMDPATLGKTEAGHDIGDNRMGWPIIHALRNCDEEQRTYLRENYGTADKDVEKDVLESLQSLPLPELFAKEEDEAFGRIQELIDTTDESEGLRKEMFTFWVNRVKGKHKKASRYGLEL